MKLSYITTLSLILASLSLAQVKLKQPKEEDKDADFRYELLPEVRGKRREIVYKCRRRPYLAARQEKIKYDYNGHPEGISFRTVDTTSIDKYVYELRSDFQNTIAPAQENTIPLIKEVRDTLKANEKLETFFVGGSLKIIKTAFEGDREVKTLVKPTQEKLTQFDVKNVIKIRAQF